MMYSDVPIIKYHTRFFNLCLIGYTALTLSTVYWCFIILPTTYSWFFCSCWFIPILVPYRGLLQRNLYTASWLGYVFCFYICQSTMAFWTTPEHRWLTGFQGLLCLILFFSFSVLVRQEKKALLCNASIN